MSDTASSFVSHFVRYIGARDLRASRAMTKLAQALEKAGISRSELARRLGTSRQNVGRWVNGDVELPRDQALKIAPILGVGPERLLLPEIEPSVSVGGYQIEANALPEPGAFRRPPTYGEHDIVEFGVTMGGDGEDDTAFEMNGEIIGRVKRPHGIKDRLNVFALRVTNNSMWPRFKDKSRVYVEKRTPAVDEHVVIELKPTEDGRPGKSFIKLLIAMDQQKVTVMQYNPQGILEFSRKEIEQLLRVIPDEELRGDT